MCNKKLSNSVGLKTEGLLGHWSKNVLSAPYSLQKFVVCIRRQMRLNVTPSRIPRVIKMYVQNAWENEASFEEMWPRLATRSQCSWPAQRMWRSSWRQARWSNRPTKQSIYKERPRAKAATAGPTSCFEHGLRLTERKTGIVNYKAPSWSGSGIVPYSKSIYATHQEMQCCFLTGFSLLFSFTFTL